MPEKFNSKNLAYTSKAPPFLAALQAQAAGHGGPDPITAGRRRAGKKRSDSEEAEDVPLVVDERGNTLALEVDKDGEVASGQHDGPRQANADREDVEGKREVNMAISIGGRKRKAGKVVGGDEARENDGKNLVKLDMNNGKKKDRMGSTKPKKKAKTIKLSFDED
ncbi:hypothetical protein LEL_05513 [Akanthomyces lecanii RCEF 1005]|uniref:DUF4604 domain-containing protein n=1 Tax=Akanthomyces lecanii RCEF 1005 TaxID=1081108 RepID=A0A168I3H2_CORDF|nr:hypothetical protein LEL_05513 [Akanthomyces lecanii RCEF 1005]